MLCWFEPSNLVSQTIQTFNIFLRSYKNNHNCTGQRANLLCINNEDNNLSLDFYLPVIFTQCYGGTGFDPLEELLKIQKIDGNFLDNKSSKKLMKNLMLNKY